MKHGKKLSRRHKTLLKEWGLNPENCLVERDTPKETVIVHRYSGQTRTIPKEETENE